MRDLQVVLMVVWFCATGYLAGSGIIDRYGDKSPALVLVLSLLWFVGSILVGHWAGVGLRER